MLLNLNKRYKRLIITLLIIVLVIIFYFKQPSDYLNGTDQVQRYYKTEDFKKCLKILNENEVFLMNDMFEKFSDSYSKILAGVFEDSVKNLTDKLVKEFVEKCNFIFGSGTYIDKDQINGVSMKCPQFSVQISVFFKRNNFYWIGFANKKFEHFGDVSRALNL